MNLKMKVVCAALFSVLLLSVVTACRESSQSHDDIIRADFAEILALENAECGEVKSYRMHDHLDYVVECESGDVYRIHVSQEGHVRIAPKQN